jgi:hypothetical protein
MAKVIFDPVEFKQIYPQFATYPDAQLQFFFNKAELKVENTDSTCLDEATRKILLYLLVAHFAELQGRINDGNSALVGRVSSATEGSVSISSSYDVKGDSAQWYSQTPYGAEYWAMTAQFRTFGYVIENMPMPVNRERYGNYS